MNRPERNVLLVSAIVASGFPSGCGPDHGRPMVFTAPRKSAIRIMPGARAKDKVPVVIVPEAKPESLAPSNGVDVPIIEPE